MFNSSSISKIGSRIRRFVSSGQCTSSSTPRYSQRAFSQCLIPVFKVQERPKVFERCMYQRHYFSSGSDEGNEETEEITVTFVEKGGGERHIKVPIGMSMLEAALANDIELEGACGGSLECATCHLIVMDVEHYNKLDDPNDEENDMLDLAIGLTETSRLGCQVIASSELDGLRLALPAATSSFTLDRLISKQH